MAVYKREPRLRLRQWPSEDWYYTHLGYRFIKGTFQHPVTWSTRLRWRGSERVPRAGPVILAANHLSWADPVLLSAAIHRPAFYLAKEGVFRNPAMRAFLTALGQIKVNRVAGGNDAAVSTAVDLLRQGLVLGVFPEGTRSRPGHVKRGKTGVARIAAQSGAPVLPIGIDTGAFWPKGRALPKWGERCYLEIGEPLHLDLKPEHVEDKLRMREATDEIMGRVRALYRGCVAAREANETWA